MNLEDWWPRVKPSTRDWLIAHNGERLVPEVLADIAWAGASVSARASWIDRAGPDGFFLTDAAVDWIEAVANREAP